MKYEFYLFLNGVGPRKAFKREKERRKLVKVMHRLLANTQHFCNPCVTEQLFNSPSLCIYSKKIEQIMLTALPAYGADCIFTLVKVHVVLICVTCRAFWSPVLVQCS